MSYVSITKSDEWTLRDKRQDILNWEVRTSAGQRLGHVSDLLIDTESQYVETVVLNDGTEYPAREAELDTDENVVCVEQHSDPEKEPVRPGADAYDEDFRTHYVTWVLYLIDPQHLGSPRLTWKNV